MGGAACVAPPAPSRRRHGKVKEKQERAADARAPHGGERRAAGLVVRGLVGWKAKRAGGWADRRLELGVRR
jgi:hypothetical protein